MSNEKCKQSLYFPEEMLAEIQREADRQDRSLSWIVQQAWKVALSQVRKFPSVNDGMPSTSTSTGDRTGTGV